MTSLRRVAPGASFEVSAHEIVAALPQIGRRANARQVNKAREAGHRESHITRSRTSKLPHFGHTRCSKDSSTSCETPNPGSPFTPTASLVRRSNSQASSEVSPASSDMLCSIPDRHGPQLWRQKRCRSAWIIVYESTQMSALSASLTRKRSLVGTRTDSSSTMLDCRFRRRCRGPFWGEPALNSTVHPPWHLGGNCCRTSLRRYRDRLQGFARTQTSDPLTQGVVFSAPAETTRNPDMQGLLRQRSRRADSNRGPLHYE